MKVLYYEGVQIEELSRQELIDCITELYKELERIAKQIMEPSIYVGGKR